MNDLDKTLGFPSQRDAEDLPSRQINLTYVVGSLQDSGTERQVMELLKHLDRTIFEPSVILMEDTGSDRARELVDKSFVMGVPEKGNIRWLKRSLSLCGAIRRTQQQLESWKTDVIHTFNPGPSILGGIAAKMCHVPVIIGSRRSLVNFYRSRRGAASLMDRLAFRLARMNLGNSEAVSAQMVSFGGCPSSKCRTIYNGVDTLKFRPDLPQHWRRKLGWGAEKVVFGLIANFRACKRHSDFLKAAAIIAERHPEARFVMAGADRGVRQALLDEITRQGWGETLRVEDSLRNPEELFSSIDIYVCPSETEGFSNVLLEAMACGKPVIATNVGGNPEIVLDGQTGFLVPCGSPEALAEAAETLLRQPALRTDMGVRGRERVEQEFSLAKMIQTYQHLYLQMFSHGSKTAA